MKPSDEQLYAVAKLIGECERLIAANVLTDMQELDLRVRVNNVCTEFAMAPTKPPSNVIPLRKYDDMIEATRQALNHIGGLK